MENSIVGHCVDLSSKNIGIHSLRRGYYDRMIKNTNHIFLKEDDFAVFLSPHHVFIYDEIDIYNKLLLLLLSIFVVV